MSYAPIVLFAYNRPDHLKRTIRNLQKCAKSEESSLFVFCDGPKGKKDEPGVLKVQSFVDTISGFKDVTLFKSDSNKGLATSVIEGIKKVFDLSNQERLIVLEDDILTSPNFLVYMNYCLSRYEDELSIFSVVGHLPAIKGIDTNLEGFLCHRTSSWGWAIWRDRWDKIEWDIEILYSRLQKEENSLARLNGAGKDLYPMLLKQREGRIDSWAIRMAFHAVVNDYYNIYPTISKAVNIGHDNSGTHSGNTNHFDVKLDERESFEGFLKGLHFNQVYNSSIVDHQNIPIIKKMKMKLVSLYHRFIG